MAKAGTATADACIGETRWPVQGCDGNETAEAAAADAAATTPATDPMCLNLPGPRRELRCRVRQGTDTNSVLLLWPDDLNGRRDHIAMQSTHVLLATAVATSPWAPHTINSFGGWRALAMLQFCHSQLVPQPREYPGLFPACLRPRSIAARWPAWSISLSGWSILRP